MADNANIEITAGLPFNRTFTLFDDRGQTDPFEVADFLGLMVFKDRPNGIVKLRLTSDDDTDELGLSGNKCYVKLLPVTTASLDYGMYEIVLKHRTDAHYVVPVRRGVVKVNRRTVVL